MTSLEQFVDDHTPELNESLPEWMTITSDHEPEVNLPDDFQPLNFD